MSMTTGRGIGSLQPVAAETRGQVLAKFKLAGDTPSNPPSYGLPRPAISVTHTYNPDPVRC